MKKYQYDTVSTTVTTTTNIIANHI